MPTARRGLLLDLDGTLARSVGVLEDVYYRFLDERGRRGSPEEFTRLNGPAFAEVVATLQRTHSLPGSLDQLKIDYMALIRQSYDSVEPNEGARALIAASAAAGWRIGVVTSNTLDVTLRWLRHVGLADRITAVTTGETVARGKPAPDIYLKALRDCECQAAQSCAVEDTPTGAISAVNAGIKTYVLTAGANTESPAWPVGVEKIRSLEQLIPLISS